MVQVLSILSREIHYHMRRYKAVVPFFLLLLILFSVGYSGWAQATRAGSSNEPGQMLKDRIETKRFTFVARTANPNRGMMIQLTTPYDLQLKGDTLVSFLPYFGRAFTAPIGTQNNGIQFTSTSYSYSVRQKKKRWDITILPNDQTDVREMFLSVFPNGSATLRVTSNYRESISYSGHIELR